MYMLRRVNIDTPAPRRTSVTLPLTVLPWISPIFESWRYMLTRPDASDLAVQLLCFVFVQ